MYCLTLKTYSVILDLGLGYDFGSKNLESRHHASVVRAQTQTNRILLQPPNVTFVQSRKNNNGLIIIIDNGPQLTPEKWSVLRQGELYVWLMGFLIEMVKKNQNEAILRTPSDF